MANAFGNSRSQNEHQRNDIDSAPECVRIDQPVIVEKVSEDITGEKRTFLDEESTTFDHDENIKCMDSKAPVIFLTRQDIPDNQKKEDEEHLRNDIAGDESVDRIGEVKTHSAQESETRVLTVSFLQAFHLEKH